jgi:uncharacterized membrane protein
MYLRSMILITCLLLMTSIIWGQGTTGQISGTVLDPNGAVVQGANVKATNADTNLSRSTTTNSDGIYSFQLLPAGKYRVEVENQGFKKSTAEVTVNITETVALNITLSVGGISDNVVNVESPLQQTETATAGRVVTGDTLSQLPLPTRNFQ